MGAILIQTTTRHHCFPFRSLEGEQGGTCFETLGPCLGLSGGQDPACSLDGVKADGLCQPLASPTRVSTALGTLPGSLL